VLLLSDAHVKPEYNIYFGKEAIVIEYQRGGWYLVEVQSRSRFGRRKVKWRGPRMERV